MNTGSDCVLATQTNELGWAITPPMSTSLMPSTVAGSAGKPVRKRERIDRTNCGREKPEVGSGKETVLPPSSPLRTGRDGFLSSGSSR